MFGESYAAEHALSGSYEKSASTSHENSCPNHCTYNGICVEGVCYCESGYIGDDCSIGDVSYYTRGKSLDETLKLAAICFGIGIIIGN